MRALVLASHARSEKLANARPGAAIQLFWEPETTTSRAQASCSKGTAPTPETPSTRTSDWGADSRATAASSASGFITPVDVSLWVMRIAL